MSKVKIPDGKYCKTEKERCVSLSYKNKPELHFYCLHYECKIGEVERVGKNIYQVRG
jgi:hypothetical protein